MTAPLTGSAGTRFARRTVGVFLLCALVPIIALVVITHAYVGASLTTAGESAMKDRAKDLGMGLIDRLRVVESDLRARAASSAMVGGRLQVDADPLVWVRRWTDVTPDDSTNAAQRPPELDPDQRAHLAARGALLLTAARVGGDGPHVMMVVAERDAAGDSVTVWGEVAPAFLWHAMERAQPDDGACVLAGNPRVKLHCAGYLERHVIVASQFDIGAFQRSIDGLDVIGARWELFLRYQYGTTSWSIIATEPTQLTLAPLERFRLTSLLVSLFTLITVLFLSLVWIRRSTVPLERLHAGTKRVAAGDFSAPVVVTTDDEFAELAQSFNGMSSELHRQFTGLAAMDTIDNAAMSARVAQDLVSKAIVAVHEANAAGGPIVIAVTPVQSDGTWSVWSTDVNGGLAERQVDPNTDDLYAMRHAAPHRLLRAGSPAPSILGKLPVDRDAVLMTLEHGGEALGALAFTLQPGDVALDARLEDMRRIADRVALALSTVRTLEHLDALSLGTLTAFARAIDASSPWTAGHSERVTRIALTIARHLGLPVESTDTLQRGGLLHDIGKIGVPASILDKPGKLTEEEFAVMRSHPELGARILAPIDAFADVMPIVRHHHERIDGQGYPDRLSGQSIPLLARVLAVADVYDALVSARPYRAGWSHEDAMKHMRANAGTQFDPGCVAAFEAAVAAGDVAAAIAAADSGDAERLAEELMAGRILMATTT